HRRRGRTSSEHRCGDHWLNRPPFSTDPCSDSFLRDRVDSLARLAPHAYDCPCNLGRDLHLGVTLMKPVLDWLRQNYPSLVRGLASLVSVPSISTDGDHQKEVDQSAALTCEQMREAGLDNVEVITCGQSNPYAYGEWLHAPGKPTVFLYAHHD